MKKILIPTFYKNYGGSVFILLKSAEILRKYYQVIIKAPLKEADISNFSIPGTIRRKEQIKLLPSFLKHLFKELLWIKKEKFDIVYVHDTPSLYIYGFIAKILGIKVIWHVHDFNVSRINRKINFILSTKRIYIAKFQIPDFDNNFCYIPNFVENFNLNKKRKKNIENIVIAGSICDRKNQKFGVNLIKELKDKDKKLILYGSILENDYFNSLEIDNKKIFYKGFANKMDILNDADIIFMPSKEEAQPLIFLEAIANKIPALVPNIQAVKEIAEIIGYNEYLYINDDINDCIKKLRLLEALKEEEIKFFQEQVLKYFSIESFEKKLMECFTNV